MTHFQEQDRITLFGYIIMENHLHFIALADDLSKEVADFKSFTARSIIDYYEQRSNQFLLKQFAQHKEKHKKDRTYQLWQEGSHPQRIHSEEMMR